MQQPPPKQPGAKGRHPTPSAAPEALPYPLAEGQRVELWLEALDTTPQDGLRTLGLDDAVPDLHDRPSLVDVTEAAGANGNPANALPAANEPPPAPSASGTESTDAPPEHWDVWPARVSARRGNLIAVLTGGWGLTGMPAAPGSRTIVRRLGAEGIAEWEGELVAPTTRDVASLVAAAARQEGQETIAIVRVPPETSAGRLYQRRLSPRVAVRLRPVRLTPLSSAEVLNSGRGAGEMPPVARLADVSQYGAGVVVDCPLPAGTTVALEFDLPGETAPFSVQGQVVEPATQLHGDVQPQPDGLLGFRRGIKFLGSAANREARRLTAALSRLLQPSPR